MSHISKQCPSQDLETGCPKLAIGKFWASNFLRGTTIYSDFIIKMYEFIKIRHDILLQYHGNYMEMKRFNYMLENWDWHFKKFFTIFFGSPERCFLRVWVSKKDTQTPCWLRLCCNNSDQYQLLDSIKLLNGVHWFSNTICITNNSNEIYDRLNWSCFVKIS